MRNFFQIFLIALLIPATFCFAEEDSSFVEDAISSKKETRSIVPEWNLMLKAWTASDLNMNQVLFTYKSQKARILLTWQSVDFETENLEALYNQSDFKKALLEQRKEELRIWQDGDLKSNYIVNTGTNLNLEISQRFQVLSENNYLVERFFFADGKFWHLVFTEQNESAIASDSHVKAFDEIQKRVSKVHKTVRRQNLPWIEWMISPNQSWASGETGRARVAAPAAGVRGITQQCLNSGYDEKFLKRGPPSFDVNLSSLTAGCKSDLAKLKDSAISKARDFYSSLSDNGFTIHDYPECRNLRPRGISGDYNVRTQQQFSQAVFQDGPLKRWKECSQDQQYIYRPARAVYNAATNPETYRSLYQATKRYLGTALALAYYATSPGAVSSALAQTVANGTARRAYDAAVLYVRQNVTNFECLNQQAQAEIICGYGAKAVASAGALACTAATKGRCLATLRGQLGELGNWVKNRFGKKAVAAIEARIERNAAAREVPRAPAKEAPKSRETAAAKNEEPELPRRSPAERAAIETAERKSATLAADLESQGAAKLKLGFPCKNITSIYPNSFPDESRNCIAVTAEKDISGIFCGCGKVGKSNFNYTFPCPQADDKLLGIRKFSNDFSLPSTSALDFCSRVTIPKGKECYLGSTVGANDGVLSGMGGGVQLFCFDGPISDRVKGKLGPRGLEGNGMAKANPNQRLIPERWSPFSDFREFDELIQRASKECPTGCTPEKMKEMRALYEAARGRAGRVAAYSERGMDRLYREEKILEAYMKELEFGRTGVPVESILGGRP